MLFETKSNMSKQPRDKQSEVSYRTGTISQNLDALSRKSYISSSIRTTTTTRERLQDIEKQLELETRKRIAAENEIVKLTRGGKF